MKPGIFEIFRIKFRDIQKKIGNFRKHIQAMFVIFVPTIAICNQVLKRNSWLQTFHSRACRLENNWDNSYRNITSH